MSDESLSYETIELSSTDQGVTTILLDRPDERNAMNVAMGREIQQAVESINADPHCRVVIIRGSGRAFSAGGDLKSLAHEAGLAGDGSGLGGGSSFYRLFLSITALRVPSIAAINGHAIGAGLCFALGADLRVMHQKAKVGMTFVKLGIHPGMAATWTLPRLVGPAVAAELLYTGRLVTADEALAMGLVNRTAGEDFDEVVASLAAGVAGSGPVAVRAVKETLAGTWERSIDEAMELESTTQAMTFNTDDAREGMKAIMEKRPPRFEGH